MKIWQIMKLYLSRISIIAVSALCMNTNADIGVDWQNNAPMNYVDPVTVTNTISDRDVYVQLLWTTNSSSAWEPQSGEVFSTDTNGTIYGGNTYLLDSFINPAANEGFFVLGSVDRYTNGNVGGVNINLGYLYSIIYSDTNLNYLTTWYWISGFTNTAKVYPALPGPGDELFMDVTANGVPGGDGYVQFSFQLVPEPLSFSLFGLGIVTFLVTRRRDK